MISIWNLLYAKNFYIKDYHGRNSDKFMEADFFYPFLNISSNIYRRPIIFSLYKNLERALYVVQFIWKKLFLWRHNHKE